MKFALTITWLLNIFVEKCKRFYFLGWNHLLILKGISELRLFPIGVSCKCSTFWRMPSNTVQAANCKDILIKNFTFNKDFKQHANIMCFIFSTRQQKSIPSMYCTIAHEQKVMIVPQSFKLHLLLLL